jgi:lipoprotein-anchoring transpeptidase ErfK/SrfK
MTLSRRTFLAAALTAPALASRSGSAWADEPFPVKLNEWKQLPFKYQRQKLAYETQHPAGTIVVDAGKRFLYLVQGDGTAIRYGVSLGKGAHAWTGEVTIAKMKEWPVWIPAPYHLNGKPELAKWLPGGMPGGPDNPMGARALYLFKGEVDTINRIHGAALLTDIGRKKTAGCIGMLNADVIDLYARVEVGTRVVMI